MEPLPVDNGVHCSRVLREVEVHSASEDRWYEAKVLAVEPNRVRVCRKGWPSGFTEWISRSSDRLARAATHLGRWRDFHVKQPVQIGFKLGPNDSAASHWVPGTINAVSRDHCGVSRMEVEWHGVGFLMREWRDADDDFLAPPGHPMYSLITDGADTSSSHDAETAS